MLESFANNFAQARTVQAMVRALNIFAKTHPGESQIVIESLGEGALASFGAPKSAANGGHEQFLKILNDVEELMALEATLQKIQSLGADQQLVDKVLKEASILAEKLYPTLSGTKSK